MKMMRVQLSGVETLAKIAICVLQRDGMAARFAFRSLELKTTLSGQDAKRFIEHH
jgi:hypothetical protein